MIGDRARAGWASAGFSLVEMLVALAVVALGALLLTGTIGQLGQGLAVWDHADAQVAQVAAAQFTLRERLAAMQPLRDVQGGGTLLDVSGRSEAFDFTAPAPDRDAPDALRRYRLQRDGAGNLVLFSLSSLDARTDAHGQSTQGWAPEPLLRGVSRVEIRYWGRDPASLVPVAAWQGYWTHRSALPMLVRISVRFPDGDTRVWPDLLVHPRAAIPEPCPEATPCAAPGAKA
jgi:general secretion pathway protein J